MNLTNLVLAVTVLQTNVQNAITGYTTNGAAIITYVEQVQRVETITWPPTQRRWTEQVQDLSKQATPQTAPKSLVLPEGATYTPNTNSPAVSANTNSPAFKRRAEMEARRNAARTNQPAIKQP